MSPLDGTVEATVETVLSEERNGLLVAVVAAGALAEVALELLLPLLELPHPARTRATLARASIDDLGTGMSPVVGCRAWDQPFVFRRRPAHSAIRAASSTPPARDYFPASAHGAWID
jgi:hypothetical protein